MPQTPSDDNTQASATSLPDEQDWDVDLSVLSEAGRKEYDSLCELALSTKDYDDYVALEAKCEDLLKREREARLQEESRQSSNPKPPTEDATHASNSTLQADDKPHNA